MNIRLIALDLDDTLLRGDLGISEANRSAVREAEDRGIEIVLASGRSYDAMKKYVDFLELDRPGNFLVCSNGAEIFDAEKGTIVDRRKLDSGFCHELAADVEARGFPWQVYVGGKIICSRINHWALLDERLSGQPAEVVASREDLFREGQIKFLIPAEPDEIAPLWADFARRYGSRAEIMTSKPYFLEVLPLGADKGSALERLSERLGIDPGSVMAIGDAMNDIGMLKFAGWPCAPANAIQEAKSIARIVSAKTNEEDAVADLIRSVAFS
jgi:Cof subfamily protein (haloacid dehalogenase superfamily)